MQSTRSSFSALSYHDSIFIVGGFTNNLADIKNAVSVDVYVPATDTWINGVTEFPFPRGCPNACLIGDKIYAFGGAHIDGENLIMFDTLQIYDIKSDSWTTGANLPAPRSYFGADTLDGKIYVAGGGTGWNLKNTLYVYDPVLDEWSVKAPMNYKRWNPSAKSWNGKFYVFGGYAGSSWTISKTIEVYDPQTDEWTLLTNAITPRTGQNMFLHDDQFYVIGGYHAYSGNYIHTNIISRYDLSTNSWYDFLQPGDAIPDGRRLSASTTLNEKFYLLGGGSDDLTNSIWSYSLKDIRQYLAIKDTLIEVESLEMDLSEYFSSVVEEETKFSVCPGFNEELIGISVENSILTIENVASADGSTEIIINALNSQDTISSNTITVDVNYIPQDVGLRTHSLSPISVYPNPASDVVVINCNGIIPGLTSLEVYNALGQLIEHVKLENSAPGTQSIELNIEEYVKGLYFIVLKTDKSAHVSKLIVQP
jgi:hypothetical protein